MRHRQSRFQLNRFTSWRKATLISMARNLLNKERIITTKTKAMAVKPVVERLISLAKDGSLHAKRQAYKILGDHSLVSLLFKDIALRFNNRHGGYTRILGYGRRRGDNAEMVLLELTEIKKKEPKKHKKAKDTAPEKEARPQAARETKEKPAEEKKPRPEAAPAEKEKPPITKKPDRKFLGGIRNIFKKKSDSL